jgi:hypothetical protein|nr:MAG TPA: ATP synthase subunit alpha [Bacteriophage sp.]
MEVFFILIAVGLMIIWFLLSRFFQKIGNSIINKIKDLVTDEINNEEEKETKQQ